MASIYGGASGNGWKLRLDYTVTQDRAANTSSLRLRLYLYANTTGSYNLEKDSAYYVLQGQKVYQTYQYTAPGWYLLGERTVTVRHGADGNGSVQLGGQWVSDVESSWTPASLSVSAAVALPRILRPSVLRAAELTLGQACVLTIRAEEERYTHRVTYALGGASGTVVQETAQRELTWTPPLELARQLPHRPDVQCASLHLHSGSKSRKTLCTAESPLKHHILDAAGAVGGKHGSSKQRRCVCCQCRIYPGEHSARAVQRAQPGNDRTFRPCFYPAAHLCQNFQQRRINCRRTAGQLHPAACRRTGTGKGGGHDAVCHGRKAAAVQHPPSLHPDRAGACPLHAAAAAVQECRQIDDLRLPRRTAQHGFALRADSRQQQRFGGAHTGEPQRDVRTVQPRRSGQDQPCSLLAAVRSHLRKAGKMQVDGPCTNAAPAGQNGLHPAKPCQKRCAEQNGCPHPRSGFRRKAAGGRHALHRDVAALPAGRAARTLQKLHAGVHIRKMRHLQKTHRAIAQKGRCQQRQHAVFGCRDVYCAVQRHAACDDKISAHAKSPRSAKDTSCYAARRLFVYFVCSCAICLSGHL